jgi:hypothetical protein
MVSAHWGGEGNHTVSKIGALDTYVIILMIGLVIPVET